MRKFAKGSLVNHTLSLKFTAPHSLVTPPRPLWEILFVVWLMQISFQRDQDALLLALLLEMTSFFGLIDLIPDALLTLVNHFLLQGVISWITMVWDSVLRLTTLQNGTMLNFVQNGLYSLDLFQIGIFFAILPNYFLKNRITTVPIHTLRTLLSYISLFFTAA
jgi:hypothetical protein